MLIKNAISKFRSVAGIARNRVDNVLSEPYKSLLISSDSSGWVLDEEAKALVGICGKHGIDARIGPTSGRMNACIYYTSQFVLNDPEIYLSGRGNRYSVAYFHGGPGDTGFEELFSSLVNRKSDLAKVVVSNTRIEACCIEAGFEPGQIARIPIGLNMNWFSPATDSSRTAVRSRLGIPRDAFVVGSFQKDGVGWGEGSEPKLIKGPDIFVKTLKRVKSSIAGLHVLLSGPSRGYVKNELSSASIPYTHTLTAKARDVAPLYHALDVYLVASRVEGGPKAILESMASGVALVTTRVGQAVDLVRHGENGWMVDVEDVGGLADGIMKAYNDKAYFYDMKQVAEATAANEDNMAQADRWNKLFFKGYIDGA